MAGVEKKDGLVVRLRGEMAGDAMLDAEEEGKE